MKKIYQFIGSAFTVAALVAAPAAAQSTGQGSSSGQTQSGQSRQQPPSGTQSGQTTGSRTGDSTDRAPRSGTKVTSYGDEVGADVPSQGTDTDQLGRTAAKAAGDAAQLRGADRVLGQLAGGEGGDGLVDRRKRSAASRRRTLGDAE